MRITGRAVLASSRISIGVPWRLPQVNLEILDNYGQVAHWITGSDGF